MTWFLRNLLFTLSIAGIVACSSGGGGGDARRTGGSSNAGEFMLDKTQVLLEGFSFTDGNQQGEYTVVDEVMVTLENPDGVAYVGVGYVDGQGPPPEWLGVEVQGGGSSYRVIITTYPSLLPQNKYATTFAVGTVDSRGKVLSAKDITVQLSVTSATLSIEGETAFGVATILGKSSDPWQFSHTITAPGTQWETLSNQPWLRVSTPGGSGSGDVTTTVDPRELPPGSHQGLLTIRQVGVPSHFVTVQFNVEIVAPIFSVSASDLNLGGPFGKKNPVATLTLSLNTGSRVHPFTVSATTTDGAAWLGPNDLGGALNEAPITLTISAVPSVVEPGVYHGSLTLTASVERTTLVETVEVTYIKEEQRLMTGASGVAFVSGPGIEVTEREIPILSNFEDVQVPWHATSDQSWLTVSDNGLTGENLRLTADAEGLAAGDTYFADVKIESVGVVGQTIRVGLTVLAEQPELLSVELPQTTVTYETDPDFPVLAASPVEPLVFTNVEGKVVAFNVYTGAREREFAEPIAGIGGLAVSGDGRTVFVHDNVNFHIIEFDAVSGARGRDFSTSGLQNHLLQPAWMQVDGVPMLVGVGPRIYNLATGLDATGSDIVVPGGPALSGTVGDPNLITELNGAVFRMSYGGAVDGKVMVTLVRDVHHQNNPQQACLDATAKRVYIAGSGSYNFPAYSLETWMQVQELPGMAYPNAVTCTWSGIIVGGANANYDPEDIFVYRANGIELGRFSSSSKTGYRQLVPRALTVSGDAARIISISQNSEGSNQLRLISMPE